MRLKLLTLLATLGFASGVLSHAVAQLGLTAGMGQLKPVVASGSQNWYFSNQGSDSNNCHTTSTPCQTIAKHNASVFGKNDQVFWNGADANCVGQIGGTTLTVSSCSVGTIHKNDPITFAGQPITSRATQVGNQLSGPTGGTGTYQVSIPQTVPSGTAMVFGQTFADACPVINTANLPASGGAFAEQSYGGGNAAMLSSATCAGLFTVTGGEIRAPNGSTWRGYGVAVSDTDATNFGAGLAATLRTDYPGINLVRLAVAPQGTYPSYTWASPAALAPFVNAMTALGVVVVVENHDDNNAVYTGAALTAESAWYASQASYYLANSGVLYQTMNEPGINDSPQMAATYAALRGTGYAGIVFVEAGEGAAGESPPSTYVGSLTPFASMVNVAWDLHCYNWQSSYSTSEASILADQDARISAYQTVATSNPGSTMPVISLETGISTNGSAVDPGGEPGTTPPYVQVAATFGNTNLTGASAWAWDNFQGANSMTNSFGGPLNAYGTGVAAIIGAGPGVSAQGPRKPLLNIDSVVGVTWNGVLLFANGTPTQFGVQISNSSGVTIENGANVGFNTTASSDSSAEIQLQGDLDGALSNISLLNNYLAGLAPTSPDDCGICSIGNGFNITTVTIDGVYITNEGTVVGHPPPAGEGITLTGVNGFAIRNFRVTAIGANSTSCGGPSGVETYDSKNGIIEQFEVDHVTYSGSPGSGPCDGDGIDIDGDSHNVAVQHGFTHDNKGPGINLWVGPGNDGTTWGPNTVFDVISQNDGQSSDTNIGSIMATGGGATGGPSILNIVGNTIEQLQTTNAPSSMVFEVNCCGTNNNISGLIADNIIGAAINGAGFNTYISFGTNTEPNLHFLADDYNPLGSGNFLVHQYGSSNYASLAAWMAAAPGGEVGALLDNPSFSGTPPNPGCNFLGGSPGPQPCPTQYQLAGGSPLFGVGLNPTLAPYSLAVPATDYYGNPVPNGVGSGFNMGAYGGIGTSGPGITSVTSTCTGSVSAVGQDCVYNVTFSATVFVGGSWHPRLNLATSPAPAFAYLCDDVDAARMLQAYAQNCKGTGNGSGTNVLHFGHRLLGGQSGAVVTSSLGINLNGSTITTSGGGGVSLTGANSIPIAGLSYAPGNAYCVNPSTGSDASSGICPTAFKTLVKAQTAMVGSGIKTTFLRAGTYTGLATTTVSTNGSPSTVQAYIARTGPNDNNENWVAWPGETVTVDGASTGPSNGVGLAFNGVGVSNTYVQGINFQNFSLGCWNEWTPNGFTALDNSCQGVFPQDGGALGGSFAVLNWWTNVNISHNNSGTSNGWQIVFNSGQSGLGGFTMTETIDNNIGHDGCKGIADCGLDYPEWDPFGNSVGLSAGRCQDTDNLLYNAADGGGGILHYFDDWASNCNVKGNIGTGKYKYAVQVHGGSHIAISNNIWDTSWISSTKSSGDNFTTMFFPNSNSPGCGGCSQGVGNTESADIIYNGSYPGFSAGAPMPEQGIIYTPDIGLPTLPAPDWFFTVGGSFPSPICWAGSGGLGSGCVVDYSSPTITNPLFAGPNPVSPTAAGYQVLNTAITSGGYANVPQGQGQR